MKLLEEKSKLEQTDVVGKGRKRQVPKVLASQEMRSFLSLQPFSGFLCTQIKIQIPIKNAYTGLTLQKGQLLAFVFF